jgi:hypothetical protein
VEKKRKLFQELVATETSLFLPQNMQYDKAEEFELEIITCINKPDKGGSSKQYLLLDLFSFIEAFLTSLCFDL